MPNELYGKSASISFHYFKMQEQTASQISVFYKITQIIATGSLWLCSGIQDKKATTI